MIEPTISNQIRKRRQKRFLTVFCCLILTFFVVQLLVSSGSKKAAALMGGTKDSPASIPASAENTDLVIDGGYTNADAITVWDDNSTSEGCPSADIATSTVGVYKFSFFNTETHKCVYVYDTNTDKLGYYSTLQTEHVNARKARYNDCIDVGVDHHGNPTYTIICSGTSGVYLQHSVSDYELFDTQEPKEKVPDYADEMLPYTTALQAPNWDNLTWTNVNAYNYTSNTSFDANGCQINNSNQDFPYYNEGSFWINQGYSGGMCYYARGTNLVRWSDLVKTVDSTKNIGHTAGTACTFDQAKTDPHCNTKRTFKSLTLKNGAVLTHRALTADDMLENITNSADKSLADEAIGLARLKKVDLVITEKLTINDTSQINVDGKGYTGGDYDVCQASSGNDIKGYGKGAGSGAFTNSGMVFASGAGYGGKGQAGTWYPGGANYGDSTLTTIDYGSGGGGAGYNGCAHVAIGGSGGGIIRIKASTVDITGTGIISANGAPGSEVKTSSDQGSSSGSGSGGSIYMQFDSFSKAVPTAMAGDANAEDGLVTTKNLTISYLFSPVYNVLAKGGGKSNIVGQHNMNAVGGGGIIYLEKNVPRAISVKKVLSPVMRNGIVVTDTTKFNPYALQLGDVIKVEIYLGSFTGMTDLKDEFMKTSTGAKCAYYDSGSSIARPTPSPLPTTASDTISWSGLDAVTYASTSGVAGTPIVYYCKVQK